MALLQNSSPSIKTYIHINNKYFAVFNYLGWYDKGFVEEDNTNSFL